MRSFDFIIVGGGSVGSVLEAGKDWRGADSPVEIRSLNSFHAFQRPEFFWIELSGRLTDAKQPEQYDVGKGLGAVYSEGRVEVESADPTRTPFVHVGMLSDRRDLVRLRQGVRHLFTLVKDGAFAEAIEGEAKLAPRGAEGRPTTSFARDDDLSTGIITWMRPSCRRLCAATPTPPPS